MLIIVWHDWQGLSCSFYLIILHTRRYEWVVIKFKLREQNGLSLDTNLACLKFELLEKNFSEKKKTLLLETNFEQGTHPLSVSIISMP